MIQLTEFDKKRIEGLVYLHHKDNNDNNDQHAIECFEEALAIREDSFLYAQIAIALCRLRQYKAAQDYALKAIESGYDAYRLYSKITVDNLANVSQAVEVLNKGIEKHDASACLSMAMLHINNVVEPDMVDYVKASHYLDLAFEYAPDSKKGLIAYRVSHLYRTLNSVFLYTSKCDLENKELHYFKIFQEYGGVTEPRFDATIELFNMADQCDDYSIFEKLYERLDGDTYAIFGLLLLQEEFEKTGTLVITNNLGINTLLSGAISAGNGACLALSTLCYASDFKGVEWNPKEAIRLLEDAMKKGIYISRRFESLYQGLMGHIDADVRKQCDVNKGLMII